MNIQSEPQDSGVCGSLPGCALTTSPLDGPLPPVLRWKQGHQAFHLLLIVMTSLLEESCILLKREDWNSLLDRLQQLVVLYDAATACMRYAADFPSSEYERVVRPSMMPPAIRPGFSGMLNRDHEQMLRTLRKFKAKIAILDASTCSSVANRSAVAEVINAWGQVRASQRRNRRAHSHVCSELVIDGGSLLQKFYQERAVMSELRSHLGG